MTGIFDFIYACFGLALVLTIFVLLEKLRKAEIRRRVLETSLETAYGLIIRHHVVNTAAEWGVHCKVCHRADGTEPEMDGIVKALSNT